ncbi:MAG: ester cyclase, partial [Dehalococcoidia bacterium]
KGDLSIADELFAEDFVNYDPGRGTTPDREGMKQFLINLRAAFPDQKLTVEDLIAEGDKVVLRFTGSGTHKGDLSGIPPTGKQFNVPGVSILRIADGKVVERWNVSDYLLLLQQLGIIPAM